MRVATTIAILVIIAVISPMGISSRLAHADLSSCDPSTRILLIQDITPWAGSTNHDPNGADVNELNAQNQSFCTITSSQIDSTSLTQFLEIIIPSAQSQAYYDNLFPGGTIDSNIDSWVANGGVLSANLADCANAPGAGGGWFTGFCGEGTSYTFIAGVTHVQDFVDKNTINDSSHPVVTGQFGGSNGGQIVDQSDLQDLDGWRSSSHSYFANLPDETDIILSEPSGPVFVEYRYGDGLVVATTTSIEFRYDYFQPQFQNLKLMANEIGYQDFKAFCQVKDGDGDFNGNHGHGHFHFNKNHCKDGSTDQVSMSDRGDGSSFQSDQIQTVQSDPTIGPRTITIAGIGTVTTTDSFGITNTLPVVFTFVAVETGPTTPGFVSLVTSDRFSNAGLLTSGTVTLHGW